MSASTTKQRMAALDAANAIRITRARQREALVGCSRAELESVLLDPPPELASYHLGILITGGKGNPALVRKLGPLKLRKALASASLDRAHRRQLHVGLRLRDLTDDERKRFVAALLLNAPKAWREGK